MLRLTLALNLALLGGCAVTDIQSTSGAAYLATSGITDPHRVAQIQYEPDLAFPARVGLYRTVYGRPSIMPNEERQILQGLMPRGLGEMVHLGPLDLRFSTQHWDHRGARFRNNVLDLAASRHLDYLLILNYEPTANTVEALFVDVVTGYPYASFETHLPGRGRSNLFGGHLRNPERQARATRRMTQDVAEDLDAMLHRMLDGAEGRS